MNTIITLLSIALLGIIAAGIYLHFRPLQPERARRLFLPTVATNLAYFLAPSWPPYSSVSTMHWQRPKAQQAALAKSVSAQAWPSSASPCLPR